MGVKGLSVPPSTYRWLRDYLIEYGPINPYGFWQHLQEIGKRTIAAPGAHRLELLLAEQRRRMYLAPSYGSVRRLFWMLAQVGAIEFDREEPSKRGKPRRFYRLGDERWFVAGLQVYFWPETGLGGTRYRSYKARDKEPPIKALPEGVEIDEAPDFLVTSGAGPPLRPGAAPRRAPPIPVSPAPPEIPPPIAVSPMPPEIPAPERGGLPSVPPRGGPASGAERLEMDLHRLLPVVDILLSHPSVSGTESLCLDVRRLLGRVIDAEESATGSTKDRLGILLSKVEDANGFCDLARAAARQGNLIGYRTALNRVRGLL